MLFNLNKETNDKKSKPPAITSIFSNTSNMINTKEEQNKSAVSGTLNTEQKSQSNSDFVYQPAERRVINKPANNKQYKEPVHKQYPSRENSSAPALKIIPIGGTTTIQKNMYVYECGNDIIVFDCGIGFPDADEPGVDIIIPDFTYILENRAKVRGIVITHGHDDHRSSIPYLLREHKFDIYAIKFVKALIEKQLEEYSNLENFKVRELNPDRPLQLGCFTLNAFRVNHSIPDTLGFAVDTPQGRVFHNSDYKFDFTPVMDRPFDIQKAAVLASEPKNGVLALLSDCLGSTHEGFAKSESTIIDTFDQILKSSKGRQVFITTISSNISRIYQAIQASQDNGRRVVLAGRSIRNSISVARELKYIDFPESMFVEESAATRMDQSKLTYIIAGAYGQKGSGLARVALNDHKYITIQEKSVVIFSADPIPNTVTAIDKLIEILYTHGAEVYYSEIQNNLHVSGHGGRGDMVLLANIVRPNYFIPIGGNIKTMRVYSEMIQGLGVSENRILQLLDGQEVIFENGRARPGQRLKLKEVYVDGDLVGDVGAKVIEERLKMSTDGMVVVLINNENGNFTNLKIDTVTRGFIFVKENKKLMFEIQKRVDKSVKNFLEKPVEKQGTGGIHIEELKRKIERDLEKFLFTETGRNPLITISIA